MKRRTKWTITVSGIIGAILIMIVVGLRIRERIPGQFIDKNKRISLKYPRDWEVKENYFGAVVLLASPLEGPLDFFQENINVVVQDISRRPLNLAEYSEVAIKQMELVFMDNFILEESTSVATISGYPAYQVIFTAKGPPDTKINFRYFVAWIVIDKITSYQFTYTAMPSQFDKYYDTVQDILGSVKILKKH